MAVYEKLGPIVGIIGSCLVIFFGIVSFNTIYYDIVSGFELRYVQLTFALVIGITGIMGGILAIIKMWFGNLITLIAGVTAIIGYFVPIGTLEIMVLIDVYPLTQPLFTSGYFIDVVLMCFGGMVGLFFKWNDSHS